jgi:hypothetical protein
MSRNRFDQASRYTAKMDPTGFSAWLLGVPALPLPFVGWLDTRTLPFPGDPERTCDTVACLDDGSRSAPWAVAIEFCLTPDPTLFGRLLVYLGQLWLERRPGQEEVGRYQIAAVVVNLTGTGATSRDMRLPPTILRTCLEVVERNLATEDGAALLEQIASDRAFRCLLPWIPLMRGGDELAILNGWKELAAAEADPQRRGDYGGLALVFAEAAGRQVLWKEALKEWNMVESQQVLEWMAEAEIKARANDVLRLLEKKFPPGAPADLKAIIQACTDLNRLGNWFDAAIDATSLDAFRKAVVPGKQ